MNLLKKSEVPEINIYGTRINQIYEEANKLKSEEANMSPHTERKKHISTERVTDGLLEKEKWIDR
jgi:hypothetical protein